MTNKKSTKRALLLSALSLLLCVSMLVGSTFAWFTDSVTSGKNVIAAGNLDVELTHADKGTNGEFKPVDESVVLFDDVALWEPGAVAYEKLTVSNVGDLALKYNLAVNIANANGVKHTDGKVYTLADVLKVAVVDAEKLTSREAAIAAGNEAGWDKLVGWSENGKLYPEEGKNTDAYGIVIYWEPSDNDNIWNLNNGKVTTDGKKVLTIELGVHLVTTQLVHENDSFGPEYDKDAAWTGGTETSWYDPAKTEFTLVTAEELAGLAQIVNSGTDTFSGKTVKLGANIDLNNIAWTPIGTASAADEKAFTRTFNGTFIGTGYTISNLYVAGSNALGLFGRAGSAAHIEGVTIDGAYVSGNDYVGAVVGYGYLAANCLKNCTVTDATIIATPYLRADGQYDGGTKAGVIAGYALNGNVIGNTAKDSSVMAYRDLGGIAGMLNADGIGNRTLEASGNTVTNVTLGYVNIVGAYYEGKVNGNMNDFVGRIGSKSEVKDNNGEATKIETLGFAVSNDAELAIVLAQINGSENYWNREVTITMNANTYSADHVINQYPEWNGVVGAGSSANNMPSLNGTENHTNITFLGEEGVVFTGNVTVKGFALHR